MKKSQGIGSIINLIFCSMAPLIFGFLFGSIEAICSLGEMKTTISESPFVTVSYRVFLGGAFYAQSFLLCWIAILIFYFIFTLFITSLKKISLLVLAVFSSIITAVAAPLWVMLNKWLPSFKSVESLAGNSIFAITILGIVIFLAAVFSNKNETEHRKSVFPLLLFCAFETCFLLALFFASNSIALDEPGRMDVKKPNILLITVDTLRADHLSVYDYKKISTPNIDRIGKEGIKFDRAMAPTSWTLPTLATLMTGVPQELHGMNRYDVTLDPVFTTLAQTLKGRGYQTAAVVTNEFINHPYGLDRGFDNYLFSRDPGAYHPFSGLFLFDFLFSWRNERHSARVMTDNAMKVLDKIHDRSFFMWIHYIDPHTPYGAWYINRFPEYDSGYKGSLGNEFDDIVGIDSGKLSLNEKDKEHILALYDAEIMYVDFHIGRLFNKLENLGILDDTLIILTSDHGEEFWEHGGVIHGRNLYRESVHVPLMMRYPNEIKAGRRVGDVVGISDLPVTICDFAKVRPPHTMMGKSLFDIFSDMENRAPVFVSLDKITENNETFVANGLYSNRITYLNHMVPNIGQQVFDPSYDYFQTQEFTGSAREQEIEESAKVVATIIDNLFKAKSETNFVNKDKKIILTPRMTEALKSLGYIN